MRHTTSKLRSKKGAVHALECMLLLVAFALGATWMIKDILSGAGDGSGPPVHPEWQNVMYGNLANLEKCPQCGAKAE